MKRKKIDPASLVLDIVIYAILIFLTFICLYPVWFVLVASFATSSEVQLSGGLMLWPKEMVFGAYKLVFQNHLLKSGFLNAAKVMVMALPINIILTLIAGFFMATSNMMLKKPIVWLMMFTMFVGGGMIPMYLNVKELGLMNSLWSLVLPGAMSVYNAIICKTAIEAMPDSLRESAYLDGAGHMQVLLRIVAPLIKPTLAVLLLYYGVGHWNSWFEASMYIRDSDKLPIQNILRDIMGTNSKYQDNLSAGDAYNAYGEAIKYAAIVVSTTPIMCIYPFLQKYFAKGVMIGAVKG